MFVKDWRSVSEMLHQISKSGFRVPEPVKRNRVLNSTVGYPQTHHRPLCTRVTGISVKRNELWWTSSVFTPNHVIDRYSIIKVITGKVKSDHWWLSELYMYRYAWIRLDNTCWTYQCWCVCIHKTGLYRVLTGWLWPWSDPWRKDRHFSCCSQDI